MNVMIYYQVARRKTHTRAKGGQGQGGRQGTSEGPSLPCEFVHTGSSPPWAGWGAHWLVPGHLLCCFWSSSSPLPLGGFQSLFVPSPRESHSALLMALSWEGD